MVVNSFCTDVLEACFRKLSSVKLLLMVLFCFQVIPVDASQRYFGRSGRSEVVLSHAVLQNGNQVAVGYAWSGTTSTTSDAFIMCIDASDNVVWAKEIGTPANDRFFSVTATADGGCVAVGFAGQTSSVYSGNHAIAYKFDASGNVLWHRVLKGSTGGEIFTSVIEIPGSGNIACVGFYNWVSGVNSGLIVNMDPGGNILWAKTYDKSGSDELRDIVYLNGKIIATGFYQGATFYDGTLLAVEESSGNVVWGRSFDFTTFLGRSFTSQTPSYIQIKDGRIYVDVTVSQNYQGGGVVPVLMSFDTMGLNPVTLEHATVPFDYVSQARSIVVSPSEIYLIQSSGGSNTGWDTWFSHNTTGMADAIVTKINSMTANNSNFVYSRTITTPGEQMCGSIHIRNNRIIGFGSAKNDPGNILGGQDVFKIDVDTSFPVSPIECIDDARRQRVYNLSTTLNANFGFTEAVRTFPNPPIAPVVNNVNLSAVIPCGTTTPVVINHYAAVQGVDSCTNSFQVDDVRGFKVGDTILIIQMKGAAIDQSNTAAFGTVIDYRSAGNYEYNVVSAVGGASITLQYALTRSYDIPDGKVQFVRVPYHQNYIINQPHTALPWDGNKGGVFAINVAGTLTLNADIDVSGLGFRGGQRSLNLYPGCSSTDYYYPGVSGFGGEKGESVVALPVTLTSGRGASGNGGGGGNNHNAGGGGGSNFGAGGRGGNQWAGCPVIPIGGDGGNALSNAQNKAFLGGGGGGGHQNDATGTAGQNGGGIIVLNTGQILSNNRRILASGDDNLSTSALDGAGGGGAGGSVLLYTNAMTGNCDVDISGGRGGNTNISQNLCWGTGGGGGGGIVRTSITIPTTWGIDVSGGTAGTGPNPCGSHGSTSGSPGGVISGLTIPQSTHPFVSPSQPQLTSNSPICAGDTLRLNLTNSYPVGTTFAWSGPSGVNDTGQSLVLPAASNAHTGVYTLSASLGGCTVSDTIHVTVWSSPAVNLGRDTGICASQTPLVLQSPQPTGHTYLWQDLSTNPTLPVHTTGTYWLQVTDGNGCINRDSVRISVVADPVFSLGNDTTICVGNPLRIGASVAQANYLWNNGSTSDYIDVTTTGRYILQVDVQGCIGSDTIDVTVAPLPTVNLGRDTGICASQTPLVLQSPQPTGHTYLWQDLSTNPTLPVHTTGTYWLQVTDGNGCVNRDSVRISVVADPVFSLGNDTTVCVGNPLRIGASVAQANYLWNNGSTSDYIDVTTTGRYILRVDVQGCMGSDTIDVTVAPLPTVNLGSDDVICPAETITLDAGTHEGHTYLWNTGATTQAISVADAGRYTIAVTSPFGCIGRDTILLTGAQLPEVWLGADTSICEGGRILLTPRSEYADKLTWQDGSNESSLLITHAGIYSVTVSNQCGEAADSLEVSTTFCEVWLPNAFTPNGDGINDVFRLLGSTARLREFDLRIYNRWGQLVFHTVDKNAGWDGRFNGMEQPLATYFYLIRYRIDDVPHTLKGDFQLVR